MLIRWITKFCNFAMDLENAGELLSAVWVIPESEPFREPGFASFPDYETVSACVRSFAWEIKFHWF